MLSKKSRKSKKLGERRPHRDACPVGAKFTRFTKDAQRRHHHPALVSGHFPAADMGSGSQVSSRRRLAQAQSHSRPDGWEQTATADLQPYSEAVVGLYEATYAGLQQTFLDFAQISQKFRVSHSLWREGQPIAVLFCKATQFGLKICYVNAKDKALQKAEVIPEAIRLLQTSGYFIELSDGLEHMVRKYGQLDNVTDPSAIAAVVNVDRADVFYENDPRRKQYATLKGIVPAGSYVRTINLSDTETVTKRKALYGKPVLQSTGRTPSRLPAASPHLEARCASTRAGSTRTPPPAACTLRQRAGRPCTRRTRSAGTDKSDKTPPPALGTPRQRTGKPRMWRTRSAGTQACDKTPADACCTL